MRTSRVLISTFMVALPASSVAANDFDLYGGASPDLVAPKQGPGIIVELGLGVGVEPAYEGASDYTVVFSPIVEVEKLTIPGLINVNKTRGGLSISPAMDFVSERISGDHDWLAGLNDVDATYAPGVRIGYEMELTDGLSGELYAKLQYAFGGAEDFLGAVGANLSWRLTPQLTLTGGPALSFAGDDYMNTYFGVTADESNATGGRLAAYQAEGGPKSASLSVSAKYEIITDTFVTLSASYRQLLGSAADSPIVEEESQFTVGLGLSRRFSLGY
ncbi:MltA-interacting MipA family protein [Devosia yakushimensis]|uniref:MltA-interacting MipA family protein n=1 Tax=Devosia yakushimensis TaxID=470028 RepID=A0ABQ5UJX5_9HYPH|nr:MipA/OmpV family protein [Devosia yakushimensis]GLQ11439.1 MltA-interacting MipA family protein [Devosia yakushimensis]